MSLRTLTPVLPLGYTQLEYLQNTGTQYIDLGFKPNQTTKAICKFNYQEKLSSQSYTLVFGSRVSYGNNQFNAWNYSDSQSYNGIRVDYANGDNIYSSSMEGPVGELTIGQDYTFELGHAYFNCPELNINNYQFPDTEVYQGDFECPNLYLFCINNSGGAQWFTNSRIKSFYAEHNGAPIRNLIPAKRNSDSVYGMYDTISKTFFTNAGSGTFTAGPEVTTPTKALKEIHELYKKNSEGTLDYIGEAYQYINGELKHTFSAGYDTEVSGNTPLTPADARAKSTSWKIDGQSVQKGALPDGYTQLEYIETTQFTAGPALPTPTTPVDVNGCGNSGLPSGYKKLQYIQSSGTQYIDTNYIYTTDIIESGIEVYGRPANSKTIFGTQTGSPSLFTVAYTSGMSTSLFLGSGQVSSANKTFTEDAWNTYLLTTTSNTAGSVKLNDTEKTSFTYSGGVNHTGSMYLFANHTNGGVTQQVSIKCKSFYMKDNNVLVRNLIPAQRKSDGVLGMYDTVSNTFFTNAGTGNFTAGPEDTSCVMPVLVNREVPEGYKQLEYIESSGTQYIDTGIAENINIQLELHLHNTATGLIAGSIASYNVSQHIRLYKGTSVSSMCFGNKQLASNAGDFPKLVDGTKHEVIFDKTGITIDGTLTPFPSVATVVQYTDNICIFGAPTGGYNGKPAIYDFKIYNDCVLVRNLIPAQRISDNVIGMYDTVSKTFFTNAGTGTFIAGPEVEVGTVYNINLPAPLQKIGTYKDSIESDGTLTRRVGVVVFDGTETWYYDSQYSRFISPLLPNCVTGWAIRTVPGYCSHYKVIDDGRPISEVAIGDCYYVRNDMVSSTTPSALMHDSHTSVNDFKAWLAAQYAAGTPVIIYYPLATPTETTIEVPVLSTTKGQNYIDVETEIKPSNMSVTYRKRTK